MPENDQLCVSLTVAEIKELLKHAAEGIHPMVEFRKDNEVMLREAYEIRGGMLSVIGSRLRSKLPPP